jgi:hypothetical protein
MERRNRGVQTHTFTDEQTGKSTKLVTATFTMGKLIISTLIALGTLLGMISTVVNVSIKGQFETWLKEAADDPKSRLNTHIKLMTEEHLGELVQTVIDDDMLYIERELEDSTEAINNLNGTIWRATRECREAAGNLSPEDERSDP